MQKQIETLMREYPEHKWTEEELEGFLRTIPNYPNFLIEGATKYFIRFEIFGIEITIFNCVGGYVKAYITNILCIVSVEDILKVRDLIMALVYYLRKRIKELNQ